MVDLWSKFLMELMFISFVLEVLKNWSVPSVLSSVTYSTMLLLSENTLPKAYLLCFQDEVWPHRMKNTSSLGELWLQLLEFYATEKFHKSQKVVCIRKKEPLYKFDKLWTSTNICIEDPFDLNHNLGSGLSKRSEFGLNLCYPVYCFIQM